MKSRRRDFLRLTGLAGLSLAGGNLLKGSAPERGSENTTELNILSRKLEKSHIQRFNMSGYAAPKLDIVRVGIIGLGNRGPSHMLRMSRIEGVEIKALCELRPERAAEVKKMLDGTAHNPEVYTGDPEAWKKLCEREDIDLVIITTPWDQHATQAVFAMNHGKHAATEVVAASTIEECWQLVETAEKTRRHCMMMSNYHYNFFQLLTLNMARKGFFGDVVHGECAYIDNKMKNNFSKTMYWDMWWLKMYANYKGNIYPVHGLGPVSSIMNINRGDKFDYLVSVECNDFQMQERAKELSATDDFYKQFADKEYRGNINTSVIRTTNGRTIMLQHDATSPTPHTVIHGIYGTKGSALEYPLPPRLSKGQGWVSPDEYKSLSEEYAPEIAKRNLGADILLSWRLIDCLRNGFPLDQDVYDAASWSSVLPLSYWSVKNRSTPIDIPDFTAGSYKVNKPNMDINLERTGNTGIKLEKSDKFVF
jgi:hypothetical protein